MTEVVSKFYPKPESNLPPNPNPRRTPPKDRVLYIACPTTCQYHPEKIGYAVADVLKVVRERGAGIEIWARRAEEVLNRKVSRASAQRHMKHYRESTDNRQQELAPMKDKLGDLEILDLVIQRGAANSLNWKPTIKDTIEAMKLKMQMTGNSAFDDLISLFDGADTDELIPEYAEAEAAVLSEEERPSEDAEDLADPLL